MYMVEGGLLLMCGCTSCLLTNDNRASTRGYLIHSNFYYLLEPPYPSYAHFRLIYN